ncbi:MAG TPA: hypothetical protein VGL82_21110 [Bryobacteraceae bacterium]
MARLSTVLGALWTAIRRDASSMASFSGNNFFIVGAVLLFFGDPGAFVSLNAVIAVILFFPLSTDPLRKIPPTRLALWPLTGRERLWLRILSPWLNPITWVLAALAVWKGIGISVWATIAGLFAIVFVMPSLPFGNRNGIGRAMPNLPGPLNQLIRKDLRQMVSSLDFYCALSWSALAVITRATGRLPSDARVPVSLVIVLALSTIALNLFGPDRKAGMNRYRLLPLRGWQILLSKDAAFLVVAALLTAPLSPLSGISAALAALAFGHYDSVTLRHDETRWRFRTSKSVGSSTAQIVLLIAAGAGVSTSALVYFPAVIAFYAVSTWWFGRTLERCPVNGL